MTEEQNIQTIEPPPDVTPAAESVSEPVDLDALWKNVGNPPAEESTPPETEQPKAEEPEKEEAPEQEKPEAEPETAETEEETEEDILAEFDSKKILSDEEIDTKYARVSKEARAEMKAYASDARKGVEIIEKLGGESAIPVLETLGKSAFQLEVTPESTKDFFQTLANVNPDLVKVSAIGLFHDVWDTESYKPLVDAKLQEVFGEGYSFDRLAELARWDKAGLFDTEMMRESYDAEFTNPRVLELEQKLEEANKKLQTEPDQKIREKQATEEYLKGVNDTSDKYVMESVSEHVEDIINKLNWAKGEKEPEEWSAAKDVFSEMREAWIEKQVKNSSEYKNIKHLIENHQAFDKNGNPTTAYNLQLEKIQGKIRAATLRAGRTLNPTFTRSLSMTRNARLTQPEAPKEQPKQPAPQLEQPPVTNGKKVLSDKELDQLWTTNVVGAVQDNQLRGRMANGR